MPPLQGLKKEIPIPSSCHPHPALPFPAIRMAGSSTRGRVWEGVKNGISYTVKIEEAWFDL
jgi:hypothetical protein